MSTVFQNETRKKFGSVVKTALCVPRGPFRGKIFFFEKKLEFYISFRPMSEKLSDLCRENFRQGYQNGILRVQTNILGLSKVFPTHERNWPRLFNVNAFVKHWMKTLL